MSLSLLKACEPDRPRGAAAFLAARAVALFLGAYAVLNLAGNLAHPGFDLNLWWIDLRFLPGWLQTVSLTLGGTTLISFGLLPKAEGWRRSAVLAVAGLFLAFALANTGLFYLLWSRGVVAPWSPIPLSALVACGLALIFRAAWKGQPTPAYGRGAGWRLAGTASGALVCALLFALGQMLMFGKTDYRRQADVAVVMGARVYADGRLSDALADRVRTACELYREGLVPRLIMSGGPGDGAIHETLAMKRAAVAWGVAPEDILLDPAGLNTQATVQNTMGLFRTLGVSRVIVVSHGYHLPRIKMAYQRADLDVYTVPARESYVLRQLPFNMARETAALWVYYFRPLAAR